MKEIAPFSTLQHLVAELNRNKQVIDIRQLEEICINHALTGHLAVFAKPYLARILSGHKTVESRFSKTRQPPFARVQEGNVLFLKEVAGPVVAVALIASVDCFGPLREGEAESLMTIHQDSLQLDNDFKQRKQGSLYATLMRFHTTTAIKPLTIRKLDRRSWVVLAHTAQAQHESLWSLSPGE